MDKLWYNCHDNTGGVLQLLPFPLQSQWNFIYIVFLIYTSGGYLYNFKMAAVAKETFFYFYKSELSMLQFLYKANPFQNPFYQSDNLMENIWDFIWQSVTMLLLNMFNVTRKVVSIPIVIFYFFFWTENNKLLPKTQSHWKVI